MGISPDDDKRLQASLRTPTSTFHQTTAVSQEALNDGLYYLFDKYQDLANMKIASKKFGSIDAIMDSAEIFLPVKTPSYRTVVFYCIFASGKLIVTDDQSVPKKPIDMSGWRFAFEVDFSTLDVPPASDEHKEIKQRLNQPGDYSISRLFLDFKTHKIRNFKEKLSDFKGYHWDNEDLQSFLSLMTFWGDPETGIMKDHKKSTLGYYLTTSQPDTVNPPAPTFPPTSLKHQHYKYIAPGKTAPNEGLELGKNNMFLYLEMTQNQPFPKEDILEYSGNFVTPGMKGTGCISRDNFWDAYLLRNPSLNNVSGAGSLPPLLREFNRHAYAWLGGFHIWAKGYTAGVSWSYGFGHTDWEPSRDPSYFAWKRTSPTRWEWGLTDEKSGSDKGVWPFHAYGNAKTYTQNSLWFEPGSNVIHLKGDSRLWAKWGYAGMGSHEESGGIKMTWEINASMDSVSEGGLKINMNLPSPPRNVFTFQELKSPWDGAAADAPPVTDRQEHTTKEEDDNKVIPAAAPNDRTSVNVKDMMDAATQAGDKVDFNSMTTNLQAALLSSARFVISGGKDFFYKNPMFNNNGDLIVEAKYKS